MDLMSDELEESLRPSGIRIQLVVFMSIFVSCLFNVQCCAVITENTEGMHKRSLKTAD